VPDLLQKGLSLWSIAMQIKKVRLDMLLVARGLADTREKAQALIAAGLVSVEGVRRDKCGHAYPPQAEINVSAPLRYVSRGGLKLEKAVSAFKINFTGKYVLDVGASTGGFTDCALQHGAAGVIAVDVGKGQLAWKLREDARVTVLEKTNVRYLAQAELPYPPTMAMVDVSFISLRLVFPVLSKLLSPGAEVIALIKPQFEAGKEAVSRGAGVVRDGKIHLEVLEGVLHSARELCWGLCGLTFSPLRGPEGNIEFLGWWQLGASDQIAGDVAEVVRAAHYELL